MMPKPPLLLILMLQVEDRVLRLCEHPQLWSLPRATDPVAGEQSVLEGNRPPRQRDPDSLNLFADRPRTTSPLVSWA